MVEERAARGFNYAHGFRTPIALQLQVRALEIRVIEEFEDLLAGMQHLNHAGPVVGHCDVVGLAVGDRHEFLACRLGLRSINEIGGVQPGQRAHAIPAIFGTQRLDEGELHVGPRPHFLGDQVRVALVVDMVKDRVALAVDGA